MCILEIVIESLKENKQNYLWNEFRTTTITVISHYITLLCIITKHNQSM